MRSILLSLVFLLSTLPAFAQYEKVKGDPCLINWEDVTHDIEGNPEALSHYLVNTGGDITKESSASKSELPCNEAGAGNVGSYSFNVEAVDQSGNVSAPTNTITLVVKDAPLPPNPPDPPVVKASWEAVRQIVDGEWKDSTWDNRSFRVLIDGDDIVESSLYVKVVVRNRSSGEYQVTRMSLVTREGETLNAADEDFTKVTFPGVPWDSGAVVHSGEVLESEAIQFPLTIGQDAFLTFWLGKGSPGVYREGGESVMSWIVEGEDHSEKIDWGALTISETREYIYVAHEIHAVEEPEPPPIPPPADVMHLQCEMVCTEIGEE